jgi:hypothetical protein
MLPDSKRFSVMWMSRAALGPLFNMDGAFNDVANSSAQKRRSKPVVNKSK